MNEIIMIPIEYIEHHPENPRLDLGDLTELTQSIKANGIMQNLTVVPCETWDLKEEDKDPCYRQAMNRNCECWRWYERAVISGKMSRYYAVIGNRRLEAAKAAGLHAVPCAISDMSHEQQLATMLQENMQRSDLTVYEQARGIQMMMDLGFSKEEVAERTGFSKTTIDRRLAVAALPDKEAKDAVECGYDLLDLVEISRVEDPKKQAELLKVSASEKADGLNAGSLRLRIRTALREQEQKKNAARLLKEIRTFARELKNGNDRWSNKFDRVPGLTVRIEEGAKVRFPKDKGAYYYYVSYGEIEIYQPHVREKHVKTDAEIAKEKKQHDAKELNERMRERRAAFVSGYSPSRMQEARLRAKMMDWVFGGVNKYTLGEFKCPYHGWSGTLFRKLAGIPLEENRDKDESLLDELERRNVPKGRAFLAWLLCGGLKADDRKGYAGEYNGEYYRDEDMDDVYEILAEAGYTLSEEEQAWKDGTHDIYVDRMDD